MLIGVVLFCLLCNFAISLSKISEEEYNSHRTWIKAGHAEYRQMEAKQMRDYMNVEADPCNNFFDYACGNYYRYRKMRYKDLTNEFVKEHIHNLLTEERDTRPSHLHSDVRILYQACLLQTRVDYKELAEAFKIKGSFPHFEKDIVDGKLNWQDLAGRLKQAGVETFFSHQETINGTKVDVVVSSALRGDEAGENFEQFKEKVKILYRLFGLESKFSDAYIKDIWNFQQLLTDYKILLNPEESMCCSYQDKILKSELADYFKPVYGYFESYDNFRVEDMSYFNTLPDIIAVVKPEAVVGYMVVKLLKTYQTIPEPAENTRDTCLKFVADNRLPLLINFLYKETFGLQGRVNILEMKELVRSAAMQLVQESNFLESSDKEQIKMRMDDWRFIMGGLDYMFDETYLKEIYGIYDIFDNDNHYKNIIRLKGSSTRVLFQSAAYKQPKLDLENSKLLQSWSYSEALKSRSIFPIQKFMTPLFHQYNPGFVNFGITAAKFGRRLMDGFEFPYFFKGNQVKEHWSSTVREGLPDRKKCFYSDFVYEGLRFNNSSPDQTANVQLSEVVGLNFALKAYKAWLGQNCIAEDGLEDQAFSDIGLNNIQLFFLAFAQPFCDGNTGEAYKDYLLQGYMVSPFKLPEIVYRLEEFNKAFQCPNSDSKTCNYFL